MNYYRFLEGGVAGAIHRLPLDLVRPTMSLLGGMGVLSDADFLPAIMTQTGVASGRDAIRLNRAVHAAEARSYADLGHLMYGSQRSIMEELRPRITVEGRGAWDRVKGGPVIIVGAHFACFYLAALVDGLFDPITIIRRLHSRGRDRLIERLGRMTGKDIDAIESTDPRIGAKIIARLRSGRPVAAMMDYFYEDSTLMVSPFMGRDAATPAGLALIAVKLGVPILPGFVLRRGKGYVVLVDEPLLPSDAGSEDDMTRALALTSRMNARLEHVIREFPDQWTFWPSLPRRWSYSDALDGGSA